MEFKSVDLLYHGFRTDELDDDGGMACLPGFGKHGLVRDADPRHEIVSYSLATCDAKVGFSVY